MWCGSCACLISPWMRRSTSRTVVRYSSSLRWSDTPSRLRSPELSSWTKSRMLRPWDDRSILDFVQEDSSGLRSRLGVSDQRKLDEYLTTVREVERRIQGEIKHAQEPHHIDAAAYGQLPVLMEATRKYNENDRKTAHAARCRLMIDVMI